MSVHTKMHPTNQDSKVSKKAKGIPWREAFKKEIAKYGEVGLALRGLRYREGLTQKELALKLRIAQHHISEMENGKRTIGKEMAKRIGKVFNCDYRVFL